VAENTFSALALTSAAQLAPSALWRLADVLAHLASSIHIFLL